MAKDTTVLDDVEAIAAAVGAISPEEIGTVIGVSTRSSGSHHDNLLYLERPTRRTDKPRSTVAVVVKGGKLIRAVASAIVDFMWHFVLLVLAFF